MICSIQTEELLCCNAGVKLRLFYCDNETNNKKKTLDLKIVDYLNGLLCCLISIKQNYIWRLDCKKWFKTPSVLFTVLKCSSVLSEQRNLAIQFHLECVYTSLTYYEYQPAKEHIKRAQELSGLNINITGKVLENNWVTYWKCRQAQDTFILGNEPCKPI